MFMCSRDVTFWIIFKIIKMFSRHKKLQKGHRGLYQMFQLEIVPNSSRRSFGVWSCLYSPGRNCSSCVFEEAGFSQINIAG